MELDLATSLSTNVLLAGRCLFVASDILDRIDKCWYNSLVFDNPD